MGCPAVTLVGCCTKVAGDGGGGGGGGGTTVTTLPHAENSDVLPALSVAVAVTSVLFGSWGVTKVCEPPFVPGIEPSHPEPCPQSAVV